MNELQISKVKCSKPRGRPRGSKSSIKSERMLLLDQDTEGFQWNPTKMIVLKKAILDFGLDADSILKYLRELGWFIEKDSLVRRLSRKDMKEWYLNQCEKV
jgi:hypothetical protein